MRKLFALFGIVGLLLAVVYPFVVQNLGGYEFGRYDIFTRESGFRTIETRLSDEEDPIRVLVDYTTGTQRNAVMASASLSMSVSRDGEEVLTRTLEFTHSTPGEDSVQSGSYVYRASGGLIHPVGTETYTFSLSPVGEAVLEPERIELILMASAIEWDPIFQLIGYGLMVFGIVGFVIATVGRGRRPDDSGTPRWGRGDD